MVVAAPPPSLSILSWSLTYSDTLRLALSAPESAKHNFSNLYNIQSSYNSDNVAERDFLRTEGDPGAAGYTIKEALALTRSMVLSGKMKTITHMEAEKELARPEIGYQLLHNYAEQIQKWGWICNFHSQSSKSFKKNLNILHRQPSVVILLAVPCILGVNLTNVDLLEFLQQILSLAKNKAEIEKRIHSIIDKFAERGLRSLAVARQEVPTGTKDSPGGPWEFVGLLPLFDPPRHDSAKTIRRALDLGVSVEMITGDQLAIAKETGRRLGMGINMYPSSSLPGDHKDSSAAALPVEELIEKADGFASVFPDHKYEIVKILQGRKHM